MFEDVSLCERSPSLADECIVGQKGETSCCSDLYLAVQIGDEMTEMTNDLIWNVHGRTVVHLCINSQLGGNGDVPTD
jgi:hypothetical protein